MLTAPARAELKVEVSRRETGRFEPVGITVTDPRAGLDVEPGPLALTMADSADRRQELHLLPAGRAGRWTGRFTPQKTGRYTGTVVLERGGEKEIALVPLIRVRASSRPGILRLHPAARRTLRFSRGKSYFPIGVRLPAGDARGSDWKPLLTELRAHGVNLVEVPVDLREREGSQAIEALLQECERSGGPLIQFRFELPEESDETFDAALSAFVRRWSYSPAVAAWRLAVAPGTGSSSRIQQGVITSRQADPYHHLIVTPETAVASGADIVAALPNWERPSNRFVLFDDPGGPIGEEPLPGEATWQMLVYGGIGLPIRELPTSGPARDAMLRGLRGMAAAAAAVPYDAPPQPQPGILPLDAPGTFCRYGGALVGWLLSDGEKFYPLLPRGRHRVRFWDASTGERLPDANVWSSGGRTAIVLPAGRKSLFLQALSGRMASVGPGAATAHTVTRPFGPKSVRAPARKTWAQRRAERRAAARKSASGKRAAKKSGARKKSTKRSARRSAATRSARRAEAAKKRRAEARKARQKRSGAGSSRRRRRG